jgi:hypothetical protein
LLLDLVPSLEKTLTLSEGPEAELPEVGLALLDLEEVDGVDEAGGKSTRRAPLILPEQILVRLAAFSGQSDRHKI